MRVPRSSAYAGALVATLLVVAAASAELPRGPAGAASPRIRPMTWPTRAAIRVRSSDSGSSAARRAMSSPGALSAPPIVVA